LYSRRAKLMSFLIKIKKLKKGVDKTFGK